MTGGTKREVVVSTLSEVILVFLFVSLSFCLSVGLSCSLSVCLSVRGFIAIFLAL